jgi:hypothetical protein
VLQDTDTFDLRQFIAAVKGIVANHNLWKPGAYRRYQEGKDEINPYGCADAANILYTIGEFPRNFQNRRLWIKTLQNLQYPETGLFEEATHHPIHTTAHCIAALELFDAQPVHTLSGLRKFFTSLELIPFLESLDWAGNPWNESHRGAGLFAAAVLAGEVSLEWQATYFEWLWDQADPQTGFWRKGHIGPVKAGDSFSIFPHLAGTFHYLFNHEYARKPLRYPEVMVDTCLEIFNQGSFPLGNAVGFAEIDWVYCLTRSRRQCGHRLNESQAALGEFTRRYVPYLKSLDPLTDPGLNDLHTLFGALCCLAELQTALPGTLLTEKPLRLVLDRRPFI